MRCIRANSSVLTALLLSFGAEAGMGGAQFGGGAPMARDGGIYNGAPPASIQSPGEASYGTVALPDLSFPPAWLCVSLCRAVPEGGPDASSGPSEFFRAFCAPTTVTC